MMRIEINSLEDKGLNLSSPKDIFVPKLPKISETKHTQNLKPVIEKLFLKHPGSTKNFWFATEYENVIKLFLAIP